MYSQDITRQHRAAVVIAIDQSSSMSGRIKLGSCEISKSEAVSMVTGRLIDELILRSHRDNGYRHYYDIALVGYSGKRVYSLLGEESDLALYPITALASRKVPRMQYLLSYATMNMGSTQLNEDVSVWVTSKAEGATPMYQMINAVTDLVSEWCAKEENRDSFPPLVFNITDGEASDADYDMLRRAAHRLKETGTADGKTIFINIHLFSDMQHAPVIFPNINEVPLSVRYAHLLMDMSSIMPEQFHHYISRCRPNFAQPPYFAMSYNTSLSELIAMLNIGSRSVTFGL